MSLNREDYIKIWTSKQKPSEWMTSLQMKANPWWKELMAQYLVPAMWKGMKPRNIAANRKKEQANSTDSGGGWHMLPPPSAHTKAGMRREHQCSWDHVFLVLNVIFSGLKNGDCSMW